MPNKEAYPAVREGGEYEKVPVLLSQAFAEVQFSTRSVIVVITVHIVILQAKAADLFVTLICWFCTVSLVFITATI